MYPAMKIDAFPNKNNPKMSSNQISKIAPSEFKKVISNMFQNQSENKTGQFLGKFRSFLVNLS